MPKKVEDMIAPERRRSIRNIPIPEGRRKNDRLYAELVPKKASSARATIGEDLPPPSPPRKVPPPFRRRGSRKKMWLGVGATFIILAFAGLSFFSGATLSYVPKSAALSFSNDIYSAEKTGTGGLLYSVVKLSRDKSLSAPAGGEVEVSRKASGTIVVYNDASAEAQKLIATTRFESPAGKVYRIKDAITVPGKTASGPGSVEATVYADEPGDSYNTGLTDFTLPGLEGTPRFKTIYARSKTPMAGGFVGMEKSVKAEDLTQAKNSLEQGLKDDLWKEAEAEVPGDFILFPSLSTFSFEDLPQSVSADGVNVNMRGELHAVMFKKSDLSGFLARKKITLSPNDLVDIPSYDALTISFSGNPPADLLTASEINFKLSGATKVLWLTDEVALKADLAGKSKKEVPVILKNYSTISSANVSVRPFWKTSLPTDAQKIIIKKLPTE
ncbi:hypothetical protein KW807_01415 [Candidatus Parcubacteria bacterium]|nr:hypothetical protein [Candidatus Parcubacteria bacterium]